MLSKGSGTRSMENDLTLKDSPPQAKSPSGHSARRRTIIISVAVVIAIVVIASAILIDEHMVTTHHGLPHIGIISLSEINKLARRKLTIYDRNNTSNLKQGLILEEIVVFNNSNHTSSRNSSPLGILVGSFEVTNQTLSSFLYNISYTEEKQFLSTKHLDINIRNISYDEFSIFLVILNRSGLLVSSQGYSGTYGFIIAGTNVPLSSYTALVQDEIQAMTS